MFVPDSGSESDAPPHSGGVAGDEATLAYDPDEAEDSDAEDRRKISTTAATQPAFAAYDSDSKSDSLLQQVGKKNKVMFVKI